MSACQTAHAVPGKSEPVAVLGSTVAAVCGSTPARRATYIGPLTAKVSSDGRGLPRWVRCTTNVEPSQSATASTAVDLPAPSPPTMATVAPARTSRLRTGNLQQVVA